MSIPLRELLDRHCGGVRGGWKNLKAVIPGGSSVPCCCRRRVCDEAIMDFDWLREQRSGLGTAAVIVMDQSTDVIKAIARLVEVLQARELRPVHAVPRGHRLDDAGDGPAGHRRGGEVEEIDMLLDVTKQVEGHTICALGDAAAWPIQGLIRHFRGEVERRIDEFSRNAHRAEPVMVAAE